MTRVNLVNKWEIKLKEMVGAYLSMHMLAHIWQGPMFISFSDNSQVVLIKSASGNCGGTFLPSLPSAYES